MEIELDKRTNFPSDFLSPEVKASKDYSLRWARALDGVGINGTSNGLFPGFMENTQISKFDIWEAYARGQQPIDKYKPQLGINDKKQRKDPLAISYRVLNWEILDIASKYVNLLVGRLIEQNNDIGVYAVDKRAQDEKRKKRLELQESVLNGGFLDSITKKTGIQFETPTQDDVIPPPSNMGEIDVFMQMFYKEDYCMIVQDLLRTMNEEDNYNDTLFEVAWDLVSKSVGATKVYRVQNKVIRRRCNPKRMGCLSSNKSNLEDSKAIWEDWDLTIGQFKEIAGDQLTEAQYREIAGKGASSSFNDINVSDYYKNNLCYPWDKTKITVKDCVWFSPDWQTEVVRNSPVGGLEVKQKHFEWWGDLKKEIPGLTEKSYNEHNKKDGREVIRYSIDNQYQCLWVRGTDYVVNYGKSKDMLKNMSTLGKTVGPYCVYTLKKCIMETIMPVLDNIQINWLQYQHHAAKSVPSGPAIEFTALQDISIDGAGGKKITPKQALQIYFDTGVLLWRRRDAAGNLTNFKPIEHMSGDMSNAIEKHFNAIIQNINLLKDQIGENDVTDGSTPSGEIGKAVATMASGSSKVARKQLHYAFDQINLGTHKRTVMHITGMAATGLAPQYTEALGLKNMSVVSLLSDLTIHELGVYLMKQPTEEMRAWINKYCEIGISNKPPTLYEEEAFEIQNEPNIYRSIRLLKMYRQQKLQKQQAEMQAQWQGESQKNQDSIQAKAQADQATSEKQKQDAIDTAWETAKAQVWAKKQTIADDAFLLNVQSKNARNEALSEAEQERMTKIMLIDRKGSWDLQIAKEKPAPTPGGK